MKQIRDSLDTLTKTAGNIFFGISALAQIFFVALTVFQILLRLANINVLFGLEEISLIPIFVMYFIGGTVTSCDGTHIQCSLVHLIFKNPKTVKRVNLFKSVLYFVLSIVAAAFSGSYFTYLLKVKKYTSVWHIPVICYEGFIFIGFVLMSVFAGVSLIKDVLDFRMGPHDTGTEEV